MNRPYSMIRQREEERMERTEEDSCFISMEKCLIESCSKAAQLGGLELISNIIKVCTSAWLACSQWVFLVALSHFSCIHSLFLSFPLRPAACLTIFFKVVGDLLREEVGVQAAPCDQAN